MKNYVSQKSAWIRYLIEAVDGVGRREIETRWESVKGLGDEEGFNRMVEYLFMRLFGDGYWWEFEAEAEKEGKQRVGEYGDDHWKWHVSGGLVLGANETREFIIRSLGATRKGGGRSRNDTRVASTARCNQES